MFTERHDPWIGANPNGERIVTSGQPGRRRRMGGEYPGNRAGPGGLNLAHTRGRQYPDKGLQLRKPGCDQNEPLGDIALFQRK